MNVTIHPAALEVRDLFERVLRAGAPFAAEFPLVFEPAAPGRVVELAEDGAVRSACAVLERSLVMPSARIPVGLIGSVATDPSFRGRGLASRVLETAEKDLRARGCMLALLWADDPSFYERRGWRAIGTERDFTIPASLCERLPDAAHVRARVPDDDARIHELYELHPERTERTAEETHALLGCPNMEVLVYERWGQTVAYSCLGRGADFEGVVHEWAGDAQAVLALVRGHLERRAVRGDHSDVYLIAPPSAADLAARLHALGASSTTGVLGLAKLLDVFAAAEHVAGLIDRRGRVHVEAVRDDPSSVDLVGERGAWRGNATEVLELLFAARGDRALAREVAAKVGGTADKLPLAPFAWGLDSI